jgi:hypothetical protein
MWMARGRRTQTSPERVEFYHAATQSKQCYAARHGYAFILDTDKFEHVHRREPWCVCPHPHSTRRANLRHDEAEGGCSRYWCWHQSW